MELVDDVKELLMETAKSLKGSACRLFMARAVLALGEGGQRLAERERALESWDHSQRSTRVGAWDCLS